MRGAEEAQRAVFVDVVAVTPPDTSERMLTCDLPAKVRLTLRGSRSILNALHGKPIPVYGTGENIRDWLYVEDHADALLLVLEKGQLNRSYNIGGENERRNIDLVRTICALLDEMAPKTTPYADQITFVTDRPGHDARYAIDPTRIRQELGWRPSVTVEEGLRRTVRWYLDNRDWWQPLLDRKGVGERLGKA